MPNVYVNLEANPTHMHVPNRHRGVKSCTPRSESDVEGNEMYKKKTMCSGGNAAYCQRMSSHWNDATWACPILSAAAHHLMWFPSVIQRLTDSSFRMAHPKPWRPWQRSIMRAHAAIQFARRKNHALKSICRYFSAFQGMSLDIMMKTRCRSACPSRVAPWNTAQFWNCLELTPSKLGFNHIAFHGKLLLMTTCWRGSLVCFKFHHASTTLHIKFNACQDKSRLKTMFLFASMGTMHKQTWPAGELSDINAGQLHI